MPKFIVGLLLFSLSELISAANAELTFEGLKPYYYVGEFIQFDLQENLETASRFQKVDLWVAVELPNRDLLFITPIAFTPFSSAPQAFRSALETTQNRHRVLEFEVQPGFWGNYTFYAVYVEEGKSPITDNFTVFRSNLALASLTLSNQPLPGETGPDALAHGACRQVIRSPCRFPKGSRKAASRPSGFISRGRRQSSGSELASRQRSRFLQHQLANSRWCRTKRASHHNRLRAYRPPKQHQL
jgi:hypothetical protein